MIKKNPTKAWLKKKIKGYMEQDAPEMAERFIQTYIDRVDGLTLAEAQQLLKKPTPTKKEVKKEEVKDEDGE